MEDNERTVEERLTALEAENEQLRERIDSPPPRTLRESRRAARDKITAGLGGDPRRVRRERRNIEGAGDE